MNTPKNIEFLIEGESSMAMFKWITPYIELAGYTWNIEARKDNYGNSIDGSWKASIYAKQSSKTT